MCFYPRVFLSLYVVVTLLSRCLFSLSHHFLPHHVVLCFMTLYYYLALCRYLGYYARIVPWTN